MRLTKRQLKRIIREEYTRLKRRGLITEDFDTLGKESPEYEAFVNWYHDGASSGHDNSWWEMWLGMCEDNGWDTHPYHLDELVELAQEEDEYGYADIDDPYFSAASQR